MTPFGDYAPDMGRFNPGTSNYIVNAMPTVNGWKPMPSPVVISEALPAAPKGAISVRTSAGAYAIYAFTATKAYKLNSSDYTWDEVTRLAGGDYSCPSTDFWSLTQHGKYLIATQIADVPQYIDVDAGTNFDALPGSPPNVKYNFSAGEHLVLANHVDFPNRIMTSALGDIAFWTVGQKGCDLQDFPVGEEIMGGIGSELGAYIFHRTAISEMVLGGEFWFTTAVLNSNRGCIAPHSIVSIGPGLPAYLSSDGFCSGLEGTPIGAHRVDQFFFENCSADVLALTLGCVDPYMHIIWWQVELTSGKALLGYDYSLDRWCRADNDVALMVDLATPAITWDGLDLLYSSIDEASEIFDSRLFSGGLPAFAAFNTTYELVFYTGGSPKAATFDTWEMQQTLGRRSFVGEVRPVTDATTYTMQIASNDRYSGTEPTFGSAVSPHSSTGICHFRSSGLTHKFRLNIAAGEDWTHVYGLEDIKTQPEGRR
jgi:hypothetical protein